MISSGRRLASPAAGSDAAVGRTWALKFTIALMQSARGQSFDGVGLVPDLEVAGGSEPVDRLRQQPDLAKRMEADPQLKAAVHVLRLRG
jgi:C-terminal processing protease CtpA/Prc